MAMYGGQCMVYAYDPVRQQTEYFLLHNTIYIYSNHASLCSASNSTNTKYIVQLVILFQFFQELIMNFNFVNSVKFTNYIYKYLKLYLYI